MAYIVNNKSIKHVGVLTEPNSYQTDIKPEDMQCGSTAVSKGKVVTGTGRAFEFAKYGQECVDAIPDENGNEVYGIMIPEPSASNVVFVSSDVDGDMIAQTLHVISIEGSAVTIGYNKDADSDVRVMYKDGYLRLYINRMSNNGTKINYFEGKDNLI